MNEFEKLVKQKIPNPLTTKDWEFLLWESLSGFKNKNHFQLDAETLDVIRIFSQNNQCWINNKFEQIPLSTWIKIYNMWDDESWKLAID